MMRRLKAPPGVTRVIIEEEVEIGFLPEKVKTTATAVVHVNPLMNGLDLTELLPVGKALLKRLKDEGWDDITDTLPEDQKPKEPDHLDPKGKGGPA